MIEPLMKCHTLSWGKGIPGILAKCNSNYGGNKTYGPIDPSVQENYKYIQSLLQEVKDLFPDKYIHIGGDEVIADCWENNENISKYMKENNIDSYNLLENQYINKIIKMVSQSIKGKPIVWQDAYNTGDLINNGTIIQVWKGWKYAYPEVVLNELTEKGYQVLDSTCWYLDFIDTTWKKFYNCNPNRFDGSPEQMKLLLGGEACMWGENVDEYNILPRIWPRACAPAEILWTGFATSDMEAVAKRLDQHTCRLRLRGIPAEPANGPGYCPYEIKNP